MIARRFGVFKNGPNEMKVDGAGRRGERSAKEIQSGFAEMIDKREEQLESRSLLHTPAN